MGLYIPVIFLAFATVLLSGLAVVYMHLSHVVFIASVSMLMLLGVLRSITDLISVVKMFNKFDIDEFSNYVHQYLSSPKVRINRFPYVVGAPGKNRISLIVALSFNRKFSVEVSKYYVKRIDYDISGSMAFYIATKICRSSPLADLNKVRAAAERSVISGIWELLHNEEIGYSIKHTELSYILIEYAHSMQYDDIQDMVIIIRVYTSDQSHVLIACDKNGDCVDIMSDVIEKYKSEVAMFTTL